MIESAGNQLCPKCGFTDPSLVFKSAAVNAGVEAIELTCKKCGFVWQLAPRDEPTPP